MCHLGKEKVAKVVAKVNVPNYQCALLRIVFPETLKAQHQVETASKCEEKVEAHCLPVGGYRQSCHEANHLNDQGKQKQQLDVEVKPVEQDHSYSHAYDGQESYAHGARTESNVVVVMVLVPEVRAQEEFHISDEVGLTRD